jgi:hypothetical protein
MKKYTIEITETLQKQIPIEAQSMEDALRLVKSLYCDCDIMLNEDNLTDVSFKIVKERG